MADITQYLDFAMQMFFGFGLAFEVPIAVVLLVITGIVSLEKLKANRAYVVVGVFVVAAMVTPPDALSMCSMAVPMYLLYEGGLIMAAVMSNNAQEGRRSAGARSSMSEVAAPGTWMGHPRGLATLFFTEMWERFSYYGMRALLLLYMTAAVSAGGLGLSDRQGGAIYGLYTAAAYLSSLPGGWIADRLLGQRKSVFWGGVLISLGNFALALPAGMTVFYLGLLLISLGTGMLKTNCSTLVGELYQRRLRLAPRCGLLHLLRRHQSRRHAVTTGRRHHRRDGRLPLGFSGQRHRHGAGTDPVPAHRPMAGRVRASRRTRPRRANANARSDCCRDHWCCWAVVVLLAVLGSDATRMPCSWPMRHRPPCMIALAIVFFGSVLLFGKLSRRREEIGRGDRDLLCVRGAVLGGV